MSNFDATVAIDVGGWDRRYARVIDIQVDGDIAAALVDPNGDGADLNVSVYVLADGEWREAASGNGSLEMPDLFRATWTSDDKLILTRIGSG
jgi:hypothetical protein